MGTASLVLGAALVFLVKEPRSEIIKEASNVEKEIIDEKSTF